MWPILRDEVGIPWTNEADKVRRCQDSVDSLRCLGTDALCRLDLKYNTQTSLPLLSIYKSMVDLYMERSGKLVCALFQELWQCGCTWYISSSTVTTSKMITHADVDAFAEIKTKSPTLLQLELIIMIRTGAQHCGFVRSSFHTWRQKINIRDAKQAGPCCH